MIYFIKTVSYKNKFISKKKTYDFLCKLGVQNEDKKPLEKYEVDGSFDVVFCSTLKRVRDSIVTKNNIPVFQNHILNEVLFDLKKMVSFDVWVDQGSVVVRKKMKEFFIEDSLPQKRDLFFRDMEDFLYRVKKEYKNKKVLIISHSFKMKLFEALIRTKGVIKSDPELIHKFIYDTKKTFDFKKGFILK